MTKLDQIYDRLCREVPGLELVGPTGNFSALSPLSKLVMSACMVIGRLEIFPILILLTPNAWRRT